MKPVRTLSLRSEVLGELTSDQLVAVGGASGPQCFLTEDLSCVRCPSVPFTNCTILTETDSLTCPTDIC